MKPFIAQIIGSGCLLASLTMAWGGDVWPQFRGPDGNGHAEAEKPPISWSEEEHITWKTAIHGRGWSSPVVWGDQIWLTTAPENGRRRFAICIDRQTGEIIHDLMLFNVPVPQDIHSFNSYASPTPIIEEGRVYVTFGSTGTACIDTDSGEVLWERTDLKCNHYRGAGSSPIPYQDKLIMNFDGSDRQYVIALDKKTGETAWRTKRSIEFHDLAPDGEPKRDGDFRKAFSTPHVIHVEGRPMLISVGAKAAYAYNPNNGDEYWRLEERSSHSASTRPVFGHGMVYFPTGFSQGKLRAVKPATDGNFNEPDLVWEVVRSSVPEKPSLLLVDKLLYMVSDGGVATCLEAESGDPVWEERIGGNYSASPVEVNGRIYFCSQEGKTTVIAHGREFKKLAVNQLDHGFMASPAIVDNTLFLRTKTHLYRIER